jgi:tetratricopeptide (TPR) repeat protein
VPVLLQSFGRFASPAGYHRVALPSRSILTLCRARHCRSLGASTRRQGASYSTSPSPKHLLPSSWIKGLPIELPKHERRRNPRYRAPKSLLVAWQGAGKRNVSNAEELGVGGAFLLVAHPLSAGTHVELLFDVTGGEVRARAIVRHGRPGHGMGVQFVHMGSEDRARLHRFIKELAEQSHLETVPAPASWFERGPLPLDSGEIKTHHELFALLNKIYSARLTGQLQLVLGRVERQLFFDGGQLVFATSSDRQDSLGEMMLREGALTQSQFEEAAELVKTGQRFGSAIAEMGIFSVDQVVLWVQRQLTQITSSVLDYPSGRFYFFSSLEKNVVPEIGIPVPVGRLLLQAVRRAKDLPLDHLANDPDLRIDLSVDPLLRYQAVELDDTERRLLLSISRPLSAKEFIANCSVPKESAARALYALLVLGAVVSAPRLTQSEPPAEQAAPPAPAEPRIPAPVEPEPEPAPPSAGAVPQPPCPASAEDLLEAKKFEEEIRALLELAAKGTYYELLGVTATSPPEHVKENFHRMARKFHPDRHMGHSDWLDLLQDLMGRLTIAYKTLVDLEKRAAYDKQIAAAGAFALGQEKTESEATVDECLTRAKQALRARNFAGSILWLRKCVEIAPNVAKHHAMLARSLAAIPQYRQDAVRHFSLAIELDQWNTSTYFQFGELYEAMGLPWRSVPLYRRILEIDPEHAKAIERLTALEKKADSPKPKSAKSFLSRLLHPK